MGNTIKFDVTITNDRKLVRYLNSFNPATQRRISRPGVAKAGRLVRKAAQASSPRDTGELRQSLGVVTRTYKSGVVAAIIGPRKRYMRARIPKMPKLMGPVTAAQAAEYTNWKRGRMRNPAKYAHLVEFGTKPHVLWRRRLANGGVKLVMHPGTSPRPFMRSAYMNSRAAAEKVIADSLAENLVKHARKELGV